MDRTESQVEPEPLASTVRSSWQRFVDQYEPLHGELYRYLFSTSRNRFSPRAKGLALALALP